MTDVRAIIKGIKGFWGEKKTAIELALDLDPTIYRRVDDLVLPAKRGSSQIDHVIVSVFGIFVIETKNIDGAIFGEETQPQWRRVLNQKTKLFPNPLRQNYGHVLSLAEFLELPLTVFHSIVFFNGNCEFKTYMPPNVLLVGLSSYILRVDQPVFGQQQVVQFEQKLRSTKKDGLTKKDHVLFLKRRYLSLSFCPKCGSPLVRKTLKEQAVVSCSSFPRCRYTRRLPHKQDK